MLIPAPESLHLPAVALGRAAGDDIEEVHEVIKGGEVAGYVARIDGDAKMKDFEYEVGPHGEPLGHHAQARLKDSWRERTPTPAP